MIEGKSYITHDYSQYSEVQGRYDSEIILCGKQLQVEPFVIFSSFTSDDYPQTYVQESNTLKHRRNSYMMDVIFLFISEG